MRGPSLLHRLVPGVDVVAGYRRPWWRVDVLAGVTVWAMLVPQSLGFATLAGLPPVTGLYAGVGAMVLYWPWGSSRCLNVGAESTVAILVATMLADRATAGSSEYAELAAMLSMLVGVVLVVGGLLRLGRVADFLSRPVLAGYVFGSGVLIVTSQLQDVFGLSIDRSLYLTDVGAVVRNLDDTAIASVVFGAASLVVVLAAKRFVPWLPGALVAVIGSMAAVAAFGVDVSVVGEFTGGLPAPGAPSVGWGDVVDLVGPALAVAVLVYPDSVLTARSLARGTSERIDADREFYGLGAANIGAGVMGGFPVNGSQSRSFVLADAGAKSQVGNLVAVVLTIVTLLFLAPLFDYLPTATLAAVVIAAGLGLLDLTELRALWAYRRHEFWLSLITIAAVLGLGMLIGILVAIGLSLLLVVVRAASPHTAVLGRVPGTDTYRDVDDHPEAVTVAGLLVYRFDAPIFFANAGRLRDDVLSLSAERDARTVVIDMESVHDIDSSGAQVLVELVDELERRGIELGLARVRTELRDEIAVSGLEARLTGGLHLRVGDAVAAFERRHAPDT
jgi:SulP family sulfate permease